MNAVIYEIRCKITGEVYYGSTTLSYYEKRIKCHKDATSSCKSKQIIERGNYEIKQLLVCHVPSKEELQKIEMNFINNNPCVNKIRAVGVLDAAARADRKQYYKNMPMITCPCGSVMKSAHYNRHIYSQRHIKFINS